MSQRQGSVPHVRELRCDNPQLVTEAWRHVLARAATLVGATDDQCLSLLDVTRYSDRPEPQISTGFDLLALPVMVVRLYVRPHRPRKQVRS